MVSWPSAGQFEAYFADNLRRARSASVSEEVILLFTQLVASAVPLDTSSRPDEVSLAGAAGSTKSSTNPYEAAGHAASAVEIKRGSEAQKLEDFLAENDMDTLIDIATDGCDISDFVYCSKDDEEERFMFCGDGKRRPFAANVDWDDTTVINLGADLKRTVTEFFAEKGLVFEVKENRIELPAVVGPDLNLLYVPNIAHNIFEARRGTRTPWMNIYSDQALTFQDKQRIHIKLFRELVKDASQKVRRLLEQLHNYYVILHDKPHAKGRT